MPIYTRTGDTGTTFLFGGKRVLKSEERVGVYGSIDELNSWVGLVAAETSHEHLKTLLGQIQSDLFMIGGYLAGWQTEVAAVETRVPQMEVEIDAMEESLPALTNFILPGGSPHASHAHIARSVCRRAERKVVALFQGQAFDKTKQSGIIKYLNRLSDLFFVLARFINRQAGVEEVVWSGMPRPKRKK